MLRIPSYLEKQKEVTVTKEELISFETEVKTRYENGEIPAPVHLSKDNEDELIEIFQYVHPDDWVYSAWRNHYHALLHGFDRQQLMDDEDIAFMAGLNVDIIPPRDDKHDETI